MPGFRPALAAEFLGATGGDLPVFQTTDRFAGVVGLAPAPRTHRRQKSHPSLAWRRLNVLQSMLPDGSTYTQVPVPAARLAA